MTPKLPSSLRRVRVFAPYVEADGRLVSPHYDMPEYRAEIGGWMAALGLEWSWRPITKSNLASEIAAAEAEASEGSQLVFNLCDGSASDGYPGLEVVEALEAAGLAFTGSDSHFYRITTAKSDGKAALRAGGVQTAPYRLIADPEPDLVAAAHEIGFPLFIKPDVSAGSYGIQVDSVCYDLSAARRKVGQLRRGLHGQDFSSSAILAEQFIEGREFTVLVVEDQAEPLGLWALAPGERVFDKRVPAKERFLAFERYWGLPEDQRPIPEGEPYYWYESAPADLRDRLCDLARRAMRAVGGTGYGRVDIRLDEHTGLIHVLEVNAQCGLSSDDSSTVGSMLRLANQNIVEIVARILAHGLKRATRPKLAAQA